MTTDETTSNMKPQDTTIYLLGGLNAKMDAVIGAQMGYDTRLRTVEAAFERLTAQQAPRAPWWTVASGIAAIAAVVVVIIQLFTP